MLPVVFFTFKGTQLFFQDLIVEVEQIFRNESTCTKKNSYCNLYIGQDIHSHQCYCLQLLSKVLPKMYMYITTCIQTSDLTIAF